MLIRILCIVFTNIATTANANPSSHLGSVFAKDKGRSIAIKVANYFDGETVRGPSVIVVSGNKIQAIKPMGSKVPDSVPVYGNFDVYATPGLIDTHVHLGGTEGKNPGNEFGEELLRKRLRSYLYWGVSTIRSLGDIWSGDLGIKSIRSRVSSGEWVGPKILASGLTFTKPDGHPTAFYPDPESRKAAVAELTNKGNPRHIVRRMAQEGADVIKLIIDAGRSFDSTPPKQQGLDLPIARKISRSARRYRLPIAIHVGTITDLENSLTLGPRTIEHIPRADFGDASIDPERLNEVFLKMSRQQIFYAPNLSVIHAFSKSQEQLDNETNRLVLRNSIPKKIYDSLRGLPDKVSYFSWADASPSFYRIIRSAISHGVEVVAGSDCGNLANYHGYGLIQELKLLVEAGMSPAQAIASASTVAAKSVSRTKNKISRRIAVGEPAFLNLYRRNPIVSIENIDTLVVTVVGGKVIHRRSISFASEYEDN